MANLSQPTILPVDADSDGDSALGSDYSSLTESLRSSLLQSVEENGRGYHRYSSIAGSRYFLPEDEMEQDRSELQHQMFLYTFNNKLYHSPLGEEAGNVLDLGTGTGSWAMDFADEHPECQVIGTDLSSIQPNLVPPNCKFEIDVRGIVPRELNDLLTKRLGMQDFNADWTFAEKFIFIHARALVGSSRDFPGMIRQSYNALKPGGWLEFNDVQMPFRDEDGSMRGTNLETWCNRQIESCARVGIDATAASNYKGWMIQQGFEEVTELRFKWPVGSWPRDRAYKNLGRMTRANFLSGLEGFTLRLWTSVLGMSQEEVLVFLANVRKDILNPTIHSYWPVFSVYGRKPREE